MVNISPMGIECTHSIPIGKGKRKEQFIMKDKYMMTQSDILSRGWSQKLINDFLPEPTLFRNPYCRKHPIKMWPSDLVDKIEGTEKFIAAKEKVDKRSKAMREVVARKESEMLREFEKILDNISIPVWSDATLRREVYQNRREYNLSHGYCDLLPEDADEQTMQRWIVNYIRHNLVDYDYALYSQKGKIGITNAYPHFKKKILEKIAEAYPQYADECKRQSN